MNWKTPITLVALLLLLLGSVYYGWQAATAPTSSDTVSTRTSPSTTAQPSCTKKQLARKKTSVESTNVVVNVYNAGSLTGLASDTLSRLAAQGFKEGVINDAPARVKAANVAILSKVTRSPEVKLVAAQFQGPVVVRKDNLGPGVDVIVGDQFQAVDSHAETSIVVRHPVRRCAAASRSAP